MRAVWIEYIQQHGDEGFFIARAWDCFAMEPDLREASEASQMGTYPSGQEKGVVAHPGSPWCRSSTCRDSGGINFEIVTDSIGQTEWHDGVRYYGAWEGRAKETMARCLVRSLGREDCDSRHGRRGVMFHADGRGHRGLSCDKQ
jgi:hypothetical protein